MRRAGGKILFVLLIVWVSGSYARKDSFFTLNYSRSRAIGMGAAFTAVEGGWEAAFFNPATFQFVNVEKGLHFSVLFNPFVSLGLYDLYKHGAKKKLTTEQWWNVIRTFPKALVLSTENWEFGLINHEELESREFYHPNVRFFEGSHFFQHHVENFVVRVRLAEQVFLGGGIQYYTSFVQDSLQRGFGSSYGVFIRPNPKLNVGVVFISSPGKMKDIRIAYDRFENETVNVGFSFRPWPSTTLAVDVRNISEEAQKTTREIHLGFEQGFFGHLYLRGGYYRDHGVKENRFTLGFGLVNLDLFRLGKSRHGAPVLAINYALLSEPGNREGRKHFFSFQWGFGW